MKAQLGQALATPADGATAGTHYSEETKASKAFDGSTSTAWDGCCSGYPHQWLAYEFNTAVQIVGYGFTTQESECPVSWNLEGSSDGSSWHVLDRMSGQSCHDGTEVTYFIQPSTYKHYRWRFSEGIGGNANGMRLSQVRFFAPQEACHIHTLRVANRAGLVPAWLRCFQ